MATSSIGRRIAGVLPGNLVHLAVRLREVIAPQPWPLDEAAVQLHRAENHHRRGMLPYPSYLYGLHYAARTACAIGAGAFTAVEFGVAGGNGLRALEDYSDRVGHQYGITIAVVGLDSGAGMPEPADSRDCGFALGSGDFAMDQSELQARLRHAELILGPVEQTVGPFMHRIGAGGLPPLGFVSIDLDVFTGTLAALDAMPADPERLLPRVPMYFDDLSGYPYTDETGERAAITAFNGKNVTRRVGKIENLEHTLGGAARWQNWPRHVFVLHVFDHPAYNRPEKTNNPDLSLTDASRPSGRGAG